MINPRASPPRSVHLYTCASLPFPPPLLSASPSPTPPCCHPLTPFSLGHTAPSPTKPLPPSLDSFNVPSRLHYSFSVLYSSFSPGLEPILLLARRVPPWPHLHSPSCLSACPLPAPCPSPAAASSPFCALAQNIPQSIQGLHSLHPKNPLSSNLTQEPPILHPTHPTHSSPCTCHGQHFGSEAGSGESCWSGQVWVVTSCV